MAPTIPIPHGRSVICLALIARGKSCCDVGLSVDGKAEVYLPGIF